MNLVDTVKPLGVAFWRAVGNSAVRMIKDITASGRDFENNPFPPYSREYEEAKRKGKAGKRWSSKSGSPDLRLTGEMMKDLKTQAVTEDYADIGWSTHGDRAFYNAEAGRAVINFDPGAGPDDTLHESVLTAMYLSCNAERFKLWDQYAREDINLNV